MKKTVILTVVACLYQVPAFAKDDCNNATSDAEINACYKASKADAEKQLNLEYGNAKKRIDAEYSASPADLQSYTTTLIDTQRGWLKYRDGQCNLESFMAEKGTITHDTLTDKCVARIDLERVAQLKSIPYE
ncbi:lysozyme inhibitor LprI family protein [Rosenbergiella epipactidis]|uniref:lysozyme inhibitor LprI family protein n=1 Tax=Rosenbergiella epipactidis TaxID=1544694 RepID=UPI001F500668|nr:lysozyme inhibitor LprI family protein [Rosenbergiella epipactidis]